MYSNMNISIFTFIFHEPWKFPEFEQTLHFTRSLDMKHHKDPLELFESFQMDFQWTKGQVGQMGQVGPSWAKFRLIFH